MTESFRDSVLNRLLVRKDHVLCVTCGAREPVYPGDGTPALAFMQGLERLATLHAFCKAKAQSSDSR